jgi:CO/xanthine dehydrogenase FAD-binding subunit
MNFHIPDRSGIQYRQPATVAEAVKILAENKGRAAIMGGGTDLMIDLRSGEFKGDLLVDVTGIAELQGIREENGRVVIGAGVTIEELRQSPIVKDKLPALAAAADKFAGLQIRNRGTIGGNVGHAAPCGDTHPPSILYDG